MLFNNRVIFTIGKIGFFSYFAKNYYTGNVTNQFITEIFSKDKLINIPKDTYAIRINYLLSKKLNFEYAYYTSIYNFNLNGLNAFQVTYIDSNTNYRLYSWVNDYNKHLFYYCKHDKCHTLYGGGISIDKSVNENFGLFCKCCFKNPNILLLCSNKKQLIFQPNFSFLWSIGSQVTGILPYRKKDIFGLAIGQSYANNMFQKHKQENKTVFNNNILKQINTNYSETQIELYYNFKLNNYIHISPIIQYSTNNTSSFVYVIRTRIIF
ncbi:MAG: carbohydrate porin [Methanobrevibacter sp.]|nr:carbohydrate porin [Candidatus Methanoflexus mossambicus]